MEKKEKGFRDDGVESKEKSMVSAAILAKITHRDKEKIHAIIEAQGFTDVAAFQQAFREGKIDIDAGRELTKKLKELAELASTQEREKILEGIGMNFFHEADEIVKTFEGERKPKVFANIIIEVAKSKMEAGLPLDDLVKELTETLLAVPLLDVYIKKHLRTRLLLLKAWNGKVEDGEVKTFLEDQDVTYESIEAGIALLPVVSGVERHQLASNLIAWVSRFPRDEMFLLKEDLFDQLLELNNQKLFLGELLQSMQSGDERALKISLFRKLAKKYPEYALSQAQLLMNFIPGFIEVGLADNGPYGKTALRSLREFPHAHFRTDDSPNFLHLVASKESLDAALTLEQELRFSTESKVLTLSSILKNAAQKGNISPKMIERFFARISQLLQNVKRGEKDTAIESASLAFAAIGDVSRMNTILEKSNTETKVRSYLAAANMENKRGGDPEQFLQAAKNIHHAEIRFTDRFADLYAGMGKTDLAFDTLKKSPNASLTYLSALQNLAEQDPDTFVMKANEALQDPERPFAGMEHILQGYIARAEAERGNFTEALRIMETLRDPAILPFLMKKVEEQTPIDAAVFDIWDRHKEETEGLLAHMDVILATESIVRRVASLGAAYLKAAKRVKAIS